MMQKKDHLAVVFGWTGDLITSAHLLNMCRMFKHWTELGDLDSSLRLHRPLPARPWMAFSHCTSRRSRGIWRSGRGLEVEVKRVNHYWPSRAPLGPEMTRICVEEFTGSLAQLEYSSLNS